jgi:hypothetical protein
MTFISLASANTALALAADTLTFEEATGSGRPTRKLFVLAERICLALYGRFADVVPGVISKCEEKVAGLTTSQAAAFFDSAFGTVPDGSRFGLIIAGGDALPDFWHLDVPAFGASYKNHRELRSYPGVNTLVAPEVVPPLFRPPDPIDAGSSPADLVRLAENRVLEAALKEPNRVSGLHSALVTAAGAAWHTPPPP